MRINLPKINTKDYEQPHIWYAWYPVIVEDRLVWLEKVMRRECNSYSYADGIDYWWEYSFVEQSNENS